MFLVEYGMVECRRGILLLMKSQTPLSFGNYVDMLMTFQQYWDREYDEYQIELEIFACAVQPASTGKYIYVPISNRRCACVLNFNT